MKDVISNDLSTSIIAQAIDEMKSEQGENFSLENINLAELERKTGISRSRLRRWKQNGFKDLPHGRTGQRAKYTVLTGYTDILENMLRQEGNFNIVFTSNKNPMQWRENFDEDDALLCALDHIFDDATVFTIKVESHRGRNLEKVSLQTGRVKATKSSEEQFK